MLYSSSCVAYASSTQLTISKMKNKENEKMYERHYTGYFKEETENYNLEVSERLSARPSGKDRANADKKN